MLWPVELRAPVQREGRGGRDFRRVAEVGADVGEAATTETEAPNVRAGVESVTFRLARTPTTEALRVGWKIMYRGETYQVDDVQRESSGSQLIRAIGRRLG